MISKEQEANLALQKSTVEAINSYCRVLELHLKAVAEGANPITGGSMKTLLTEAGTGLVEEVKLLRSLRSGLTGEDEGMGSAGGR